MKRLRSIVVVTVWLTGSAAIHVETAEPRPRLGETTLTRGVNALRLTGSMRADYFGSSKNLDDDTDFAGLTCQVKALPEITRHLDAKLEVRSANTALGKGGRTRTVLLESYATLHFDRVDLRVGKQIVAWGRADGINPTDNLTPRDYTVMLPFEDDQRFGTTALKLDGYLDSTHTLTLYATPFFESAGFPVPASARGVFHRKPVRNWSNTSAGFRFNKVGEGLDWSLSYFRGFGLLPTLHSTPNAIAEFRHDRVNVFGADFARNFGRFGVRGEAAYIDTTDDRGDDPAVSNPRLFWVIGVDRTFFENLNVNLQFFQQHVHGYRAAGTFASAPERALAQQNALLSNQLDRITDGLTFRVSDKWLSQTFEAEVFGMCNLTRRDGLVRPALTYAITDRWKSTIGAEIYWGNAESQFGSQRSNRGLFAEIRTSF